MRGGESRGRLGWFKGATGRMLTSRVQPRPYAAIDLIHQQPVRWTHERIVSCDGGGGPLGHPRIFINTDKPQICWCTYCGLPFVRQLRVSTPNPLTGHGHSRQSRVRLMQNRPTSTTAHTSSLSPQTSSHTRWAPRATPLRSTRHRRSQTSRSLSGRLSEKRREISCL